MARYMTTSEAAIELGTTPNSIIVTAHSFRKKHGVYPTWYSSNGERGASRSYVDVESIHKTWNDQLEMQTEASNKIYWELLEKGYNNSRIATAMAEQSDTFKSKSSWLSFMQSSLFREPRFRFSEEVTRVGEFYRIGKELLCST